MENPRFLGTKIYGPDGKSQRITSSPDLPRRSPSCPTSKVGFNAASFRGGKKPVGSSKAAVRGSSPVPKLVEVRFDEDNTTKKIKTSLPETNMFPLLIRPSDPSFNHPFFREATPKTHKIRPHCTSPSFSRNFWGSSLIGIKAS